MGCSGCRMDAPISRKQQQGLALGAQGYVVTSILFEQELVSKKIQEKNPVPAIKEKDQVYLSVS